jgi:DNA-binding NarL/FixJ family response regulator
VKRRPTLLIADYAPTRLGIKMALGRDFDICAEAANAQQAIRAAKRVQPELCLVGREIPGDGIAAVRGICRAAPAAAVVVLAQVRDVDDLIDAVRAGAIGYVPGGLDNEGLRRILAAVAANEAVVPRVMVMELMLELRDGTSGGNGLTDREAQVFGLLRRGHTTTDIAQRLEIAPVTVRRHISEIVRKLGVEDRAALTGTMAAAS